ncbi:hypothetical protein HYFRA_00000830 [Hymenoscyphus fraxineus]|uniref:Uncharacterized protein n=1 Tax=Hymenoscyphus fraxineus TaxID=746836 RepID=A0A9N9KV52_9HELO|nr:hypothetical protein HYFRA_00000830 [Hymenoscyphus fraxineus]
MSYGQYTQNLPEPAAIAIGELLACDPTNGPDYGADVLNLRPWSANVQTCWKQLCNIIKGEGTNEVNWTPEQWRLMRVVRELREYFLFLQTSSDSTTWTENEAKAMDGLIKRIPEPPSLVEDEEDIRNELPFRTLRLGISLADHKLRKLEHKAGPSRR